MTAVINKTLHAIAVIAIVGFGASLACTKERINACSSPLRGMKSESGVITPEQCRALNKAFECIERETANCPPEMASLIRHSLNAFDSVKKMCSGDADIGDVAGCDSKKLKACGARLQRQIQGTKTNAQGCSLIGPTRKCMDDFTKTCKSEFYLNMINSVKGFIQEHEELCTRHGYSTGNYNNKGCGSFKPSLMTLVMSASVILALLHIFV